MFILKEDILGQYALENQLETTGKYHGKSNILLPESAYLKGFFNSLIPYTVHPKNIDHPLSELKVKEAIELLLLTKPELKNFLLTFPNHIKLIWKSL